MKIFITRKIPDRGIKLRRIISLSLLMAYFLLSFQAEHILAKTNADSDNFKIKNNVQPGTVIASRVISINIDTSKIAGNIGPYFYGAGHEGNSDFVIPDNLRLEIIRFRAGCDVEEFYHWRDYVGAKIEYYWYGCHGNNPSGGGTGPLDYPRPARDAPSRRISLDDALTYLRQKGIEIILAVNFGTGSAQEAANYVEYVNGLSPGLDYGRQRGWTPASYRGEEKAPVGYFAWLREYFGHKEPYKVRYWTVGNEWYWQSGTEWTHDVEKFFHGGIDRPKSSSESTLGPFRLEGKLPMTRKANRLDWSWPQKLSDGTPNQSFFGIFAPAVAGTQTIYVTEVIYNSGKPQEPLIGKTETWQAVPDITKVGKGKYYQFFPREARALFGDDIHGDIPSQHSIITANYDTGPHDGILQYAKKMKEADPTIILGIPIDGLNNVANMIIPPDVLPFIGYIGANYIYPGSEAARQPSIEAGYYKMMASAPQAEETIKNARDFMKKQYGKKLPIFATEWADLSIYEEKSGILAHALFAADTLRIQAKNAINVSIFWALPHLNPYSYAGRSSFSYLTAPGLVYNLYQEHFGRTLIDTSISPQEPFDPDGFNRELFVKYFDGRGYSSDFIETAWQMALLHRENKNNPRVKAWLDGLTAAQLRDALAAYNNAEGIPPVPALIEAIASKSDDGNKTYVIILNKHLADKESVTISLGDMAGLRTPLQADIYLLTSDSVLDQNTEQTPGKVKVTKQSLKFNGSNFNYEAPEHSVSFIEFYR